jgi:hypothetical protein
MYVPVSGADQLEYAYNDAKTYTYLGMQGYLATITSSEEDAALDWLTTDSGWAGSIRLTPTAYDQDPWPINSSTDNYWRWVCGPVAGSAFYFGSTGENNASAVDSNENFVDAGSVDAVYTQGPR